MKRDKDKDSERRHARDARRYYHQARRLKRTAAALAHAVPHSIIQRGA